MSTKAVKYPRKCECGGKIQYVRELGQVFSACLSCTPVVEIKVSRDGRPLKQRSEHD